MRRIWGFAAFVLLGCVACSSSGSSGAPTSPAPSTSARPTVSVPPPTRSAPSSDPVHTSRYPAPPHPPKPTVPADVPRTGPNTRKGERPPVEPLEATQHTTRGAKVFAGFFIKTLDWGFATVSGKYMRHYSMAQCDGCRIFITGLAHDRKHGYRYIGGRITVRKTRLAHSPQVADAQYTVLVTFDITSFEEVDQHGHFRKGDGAHKNEQFNVSLVWQGAWKVRQLTVER